MCTVSNNIETSRLKYYTCPRSFTPLASKAHIPQRCGRDYTKETGISRQHPAARRGNGANRKTCHNNTVTSRQYGRRAIYVSGDVRFQDGDAFDLGKLGQLRLFAFYTSAQFLSEVEHNIHILVLIHSTLYMVHTTLR